MALFFHQEENIQGIAFAKLKNKHFLGTLIGMVHLNQERRDIGNQRRMSGRKSTWIRLISNFRDVNPLINCRSFLLRLNLKLISFSILSLFLCPFLSYVNAITLELDNDYEFATLSRLTTSHAHHVTSAFCSCNLVWMGGDKN